MSFLQPGRSSVAHIRLLFATLKGVKSCAVAVIGKDGIHITRVNANSVFDAAHQATQEWSHYW